MKKLLLITVVAATLVACNNKDKQQHAAATEARPQQEQAQPQAPQATGSEASVIDDANIPVVQQPSAAAMADPNKYNEELKKKCDFVPSGDIEKDAQDLVDMQLALAQKAADGKDTKAENDRVTGVMLVLGEYYHNKGRQDEFQMLLGIKLQAGIDNIKVE